VAPTQQMARVLAWNLLMDLGRPVIKTANIANSEITMINGVVIYVRGADHPDSLRGMKIYYAISDEHKDIKENVFPEIIRPALSDMEGGALIIGTPAPGDSQFREYYDMGQKGEDKEWMSLSLTTYDNELISRKEIESAKRSMSKAMFDQEYMASFESESKGIIDMSEIQLWPVDEKLPIFDFVVQSADTAYTEKTSNDPTAFTVWGVFVHKGRKGVMLLDSWTEHLSYPNLREKLISEWHSSYGNKTMYNKGKKPDVLLIEAKASGLSIIQDLRQANLPAIPYNPGGVDKTNRMHQAAPILELGCVWVPESNRDKGKMVTWARSWFEQMKKFPHVKNDDLCDSTTQAMIYLRDTGHLELNTADLDEPDEYFDYDKKKRDHSNPYYV
jgi:predicted phage terminase large subunit-like protein